MVLMLIGILTAISTKAIVGSKGGAFAAVVESDLRNLAVAQEDYYAERSIYFDGGPVGGGPSFAFAPSPGVTVEMRASDVGWTALARHEKLSQSDHVCAIYVGSVEPFPPAQSEGVVSCSPRFATSASPDPGADKGNKNKKDKKDKGNNGNGGGKGKGGNNGNGGGGGNGGGAGNGGGNGNGGDNGTGNGGDNGNGGGNGGSKDKGNNGKGKGGGTG